MGSGLIAGLERADPEVAPADLVGAGALLNGMDLQPDEAAGSGGVLEVGAGGAIGPGADPLPLGEDPVLFPRSIFVGGGGLGLGGEVAEPLGAAGLVPEVPRGSHRLLDDLALVAVDLSRL